MQRISPRDPAADESPAFAIPDNRGQATPRRDVVLVLEGVVVRKARRAILSGLDLAAARGEAILIRGKRAAGKTTLARLLVGQTLPERGAVWRATPATPPVGLPWGFEGELPVLSGLELRAASMGLSTRAFAGAVARYLDDPGLLRAPFARLDRKNRACLLFAACYLSPAAFFVADGPPWPAEKEARERIAPLFEEARSRAALIWIAERANSPAQFAPDRVFDLEAGVLREVSES